MIRIAVLWLGKILLVLARLRGGGGSAFPGLVVERIHPGLLHQQLSSLPRGSVVVTGTNGKTTTAKMLTTILQADGARVLTNRSGSNMLRGLLSAVIEASGWSGRVDADLAVFEVDEPHVAPVARALRPRAVLVLNLHRDQLDRYGELERTAELIGAGLPHTDLAVLNADDPLVARLARSTGGTPVRWFGAASGVRNQLPDDAGLLTGGTSADPAVPAEVLAVCVEEATETEGAQRLRLRAGTESLDLDLPLPGPYNAYNAAAAVAVATAAGVAPQRAAAALSAMQPAFGRGEQITAGDAQVLLQLVKNPSSFTQVIRTQLSRGPARDLLLALNDNFADGRDVSWIWDADIEAMSGRDDRVLVTGLRAHDLALRLKYAGIDSEVEPDAGRALERFLSRLEAGTTGYVVPTYTAMLDLRRRLARYSDLPEFWA